MSIYLMIFAALKIPNFSEKISGNFVQQLLDAVIGMTNSYSQLATRKLFKKTLNQF